MSQLCDIERDVKNVGFERMDHGESDAAALLELVLATQVTAGQRALVTEGTSAPVALRKLSQRDLLAAVEKHTLFQTGRSSGRRANLGSCDLSFLDPRGIVLIGVELNDANLQNVDLRGSDLSE